LAREPKARRPRVRKTAPTVRERQIAAAQEQSAPAKTRRISSAAARPLRAMKLSERRPVKAAGRVLSPLRWLGSKIVPKYLVNSWREVRLVIWPARRETWRLTLAVFIFAIVFGALVAGVDKGLDEVFKKVVLK